MAASPKHRRQHSSPASSHRRRTTPRRQSSTSQLLVPKGPCNWRNLQHGNHAGTCGCRRFWPQAGSTEQERGANVAHSLANTESTSCFCGHHACFHAEFEEHAVTPSTSVERPRAPQQHMSQAMPPPSTAQYPPGSSRGHARPVSRRSSNTSLRPTFDANVSRDSLFGEPRPPPGPMSTAVRAHADMPRSAMSGLGLYIEQTRNQPYAQKLSAAAKFAIDQLPPTRTPSRTTPTDIVSEPSTGIRASPSHVFAQHVARVRAPPLGLGIPQNAQVATAHPEDIVQSATEIATPSMAGTPALRAADDVMDGIKKGVATLQQDVVELERSPKLSQRVGRSAPNISTPNVPVKPSIETARVSHSSASITTLITLVASLRHMLAETPNLGVSLASLGQRVDALETASFAHSAIDEHNDRFELFDARLLEIESRVDELEQSRQTPSDADTSFSEVDSSALDARDRRGANVHAPRAGQEPTPLVDMRMGQVAEVDAEKSDAVVRLHHIEQRLADLSATQHIPSSTPNTVEVILLPWGHKLKGMWSEAKEASQMPTTNEHTPSTQATQSAARKYPDSDALLEEWPQWKLAPKAIGPTSGLGGRIYNRLKSRGFVRKVTFSDSSARVIHTSIRETFQDLLGHDLSMAHATRSSAYRARVKTRQATPLLGLKSAFVPLRKVHKHSRLRFLSEPELSTPALWTLQFLDVGVFMKAPAAGITRLFVTTPSAYLQEDSVEGWSWQKIRELPRVSDIILEPSVCRGSAEDNGGVPEADAMEPCWEYDSRLDATPSHQCSFASSVSFESSHHPSPPQTKPDASDADEEESEYDEDSGDDPEVEFEAFSSDHSPRGEHHSSQQAPITPNSELIHTSRPLSPERRAVSMPMTDLQFSSSMPHITHAEQPHPKRQVASFDNAATFQSNAEPLFPKTRPLSSMSKRRRLSRTPSGRALPDAEAPWALTPGRSNVASSIRVEEVEPEYNERVGLVGVKVPLKDRGATAYATPFSFSGPGRLAGENDTEMDGSGSSHNGDADDDSYHESECSSDEDDPEFADEPSPSNESEAEMDHAITTHEELWQGVGDDELVTDDDGYLKGKRKRIGHRRRKTGPRHKARLGLDVSMSDDDDERDGTGEVGFRDDEDEGDDDSDDDDYDELGVQ